MDLQQLAMMSQLMQFDDKAHLAEHSYFEKCKVDKAYDEEAEALVIKPTEEDLVIPAPVILLLLGQGQVDGRQPLTTAGVDLLMRSEPVRSRFFTIVPKPSTKSGLVRYTGEGWKKEWSHEAVWAIFSHVLRKLGDEKVNPAKLYLTGMSMGAAGVWAVATHYGEYFAAAAPISGACNWPGDSWPKYSDPRPDIIERLHNLPMRVYQIDNDNYAGNPLRDVEWLTRDLQEKTREIKVNGIDQSKIDVTVRTWCWDKDNAKGAKTLELWWVAGPLTDNVAFKEKDGSNSKDDHCLWWRVFPNMQWGMAGFFLRCQSPVKQFSFNSKPIMLDTSADRAALFEQWGGSAPLTVDVASEEKVQTLAEEIRKQAKELFKFAKGKKITLNITFESFTEDKKEEKKEPEVAPEAPKEEVQIDITVHFDLNNPDSKFDLKVKDGESVFAVKMMIAQFDLQKAGSFNWGIKRKPDVFPERLADDYQLRAEDRDIWFI